MKSIFCLLSLIFLFSISHAQLMTSDNVDITITGGAQVTVKGDIQNQNAATINNSGTIDLNGNWIHNAANNCFGVSQGTVILNGANQTIGGTNLTAFNNLTLQGSGTKTLLVNSTSGGGNAIPSGILNVGNVVLDLNSRTMNISNTSAGAITFGTGCILSEDADNSSKINWTINAVAGPHTIPFGNTAAVQIPFTFNLASGNAGNVTVSTYATTPANLPLPVTPVLVTHVRNNAGLDNSANTVDRFWEIDPSTGGISAALTFTYAASENATSSNVNMRAQRWNLPLESWETPLAGQINPTSQSVFVNNVLTFGPWAIATQATPLPVELLSFNAIPINNKQIFCKWITASEINNDYFTVERSNNGEDFEKAGIIKGAGNSTVIISYSFTDEHPYPGKSYYRLRQTDFNSAFSFSQIIAINLNSEILQIFSLYPNPAKDHLEFYIVSEDEYSTLEVFNITGERVMNKAINNDGKGNYSESLDISSLPAGIYLLRVAGESGLQIKKFIKE